jgi:hypothetical protein
LISYDDILAEENDVVQKALKRLPPRLAYDRMFRHRRAMQLSLMQQVLPVNEQTTVEQVRSTTKPERLCGPRIRDVGRLRG